MNQFNIVDRAATRKLKKQASPKLTSNSVSHSPLRIGCEY